MDKEAQKRRPCHSTALSVISSLCSVASVAFCVFLSFNAADIKSRVVDLESGDGEHTFGYSVDDFNSLIQQRVDELLSQVSVISPLCHLSFTRNYKVLRVIANESHVRMNETSFILFFFTQRTYENYVKIRTARQTSPECNCPPGIMVIMLGVCGLATGGTGRRGEGGACFENEWNSLSRVRFH